MRFVAGHGTLRRGLVAFGLLALTAGSASAQLKFDGNVLFNNGSSGTLVGQFGGAPVAPANPCPAGYNAGVLGTVSFTHNVYVDPLLSGAVYQPNVVPNFQPVLGSPAYNHSIVVPADGFFEQKCWSGAIGPNPGDDWTQGWTYYDSTGANRQDLHLTGMPDPRPLAVYNNINLMGKAFWGPDSNYLVRGQLRVKSQASLTIAPGVVVFEEKATIGTIIVERGGQLWAVANACEPIIITSDQPPGLQARGDVGGLFLNGRAKVNVVNSCAGDSAASEGGSVGYYGGNDDDDGSGALRYVRVEFAGKEITANNELNAFTWNGCGRNTRGDYLQAFRGADDGFEWFGGTMNQKYLLAVDGTDDGYDTQMGTRNRAQFVIVRVSPQSAPSGTQNGERGIEADNNEFNFDQLQCSGRSSVTIANATFVGDRRVGASFPGATQGAQWRRGTSYTLVNSIIYNFKNTALSISDDPTWSAHCAAIPADGIPYCPGALGVTPVSSGNVLVTRSRPNPFRNQVSFTFALPKAGPVSVEIFSADGRHVDTVARGEMAAGQHTLTWSMKQDIPTGMYFYRVLADGQHSTGKITRVD